MRLNPPTSARHLIAPFIVFIELLLLTLLILAGCQKNVQEDLHEDGMKLIAGDFVSPIQLVASHHSERLYIVDQIGKVWVIDRTGYKRPTPFLDISSKLVSLDADHDERGLIGFALHPDFKLNGRFFVYYQLPPRAGGPAPGVSWNNLSRISEFHVLSDTFRADLKSEKVLLEWDDPQPDHNGGSLAFGNDNYLYIAIGDGGGDNDTGPGHVNDWYTPNTGGNAQNIEANFLGKILRIDVDNGSPYSVPVSNPFVNKPGLDEIFAFGFRDPYHMSFDMEGDHQLIVPDAGQVLWEEINVINKGGNYGWNIKEGTHCFSSAENSKVPSSCPSVDDRGKQLLQPVIELNNWQNPLGGNTTRIIGGYVYRGTAIPEWAGKYIFGSFSQIPSTANGELFITTPLGGPGTTWPYEKLMLKKNSSDLGYYLKGFGQDNDGEIYITVSSNAGPGGNSGKVYKLVAPRWK